ncbi:MAG: hypothetical protein MZW92_28780 [Comamonadaceae bacterium]|nr:hypothetical protein [Comamonadaceae bacterium]
MTAADNGAARAWLDGTSAFLSFHWHGETFSVPPAPHPSCPAPTAPTRRSSSASSLGMQCHVEMTEAMIRLWNRQWADEVNGNRGPSVQSPAQMYEDMEARLTRLHARRRPALQPLDRRPPPRLTGVAGRDAAAAGRPTAL